MYTNYGFIIYTQVRMTKLLVMLSYTSQDDKITSDALSRCQKNQKNPGPGPRDLSRQSYIHNTSRGDSLPLNTCIMDLT